MDFNIRMATAEEASHALNIIDAVHALLHIADDPDGEHSDDYKELYSEIVGDIVTRTHDKENDRATVISEVLSAVVPVILTYEKVTGLYHADIVDHIQKQLHQYVSGQN